MNLENELQQALKRAAAGDREPGVRLGEVQGRARRVRARRRTGALAAVAAVVVVIGAPTVALVHHDDSTPPPAHRGTPAPVPTPTPSSTPAPDPTPDPTPTTPTAPATPAARTLASIPRGASTFVSWADASGLVHAQGRTAQLPGTMGPDVQFHELHGGWVVTGGDANTARVYDTSGRLTASGTAAGITVTGDRTELAWMMGGRLYETGLSTMGNVPPTPSPDAASIPAGSFLAGYLPDGPALLEGDALVVTSGSRATTVPLPAGFFPMATSQSADLVGGSTGTPAQGDVAGAVYDVRAGKTLWQNSWRPLRFSDDGTLAAAVPAAENGDPSTIAILDARTGQVLAQTHDLGKGLYLGLSVAWDDHRLLFSGIGDHGTQAALLALGTSGDITRVSDVLDAARPGGAYVVFEAQP
ncbi:MAG: hypothetical protein ACTHNS_01935 [Marmoricola sp.]